MLRRTKNVGCPRKIGRSTLAAVWIAVVMLGAWDGRGGPNEGAGHTDFDSLLRKHVSHGEVDYLGFHEDVAELDRYLASLAQANLDGATRERKLAFYVNAYNACTIRLILRHLGSIRSIRDIPKRWDTREWKLAGETLSLNDIENKKLREELEEPRIHFAIVCASVSCPNLASHAYTENGIEAELDEAARSFMRSPKHVQTEIKEGFFGTSYVLYLSRIFKWFGDDFTDHGRRRVSDFVARFTDVNDASFIREHVEELSVRYLDYDWGLNEKKTSS